ncbi:dihydrolipoamide acetyltransferase family protein [Pseudonocardia nigra]|uniref:dihydrolipoamide acetyltransferase family protein n=1 Tax=Pseudonocardia nigra TaxID=1921578 RepID=UPI001C5DFCF1|nr:dihydrolipoamide acetyltransferase family protein [Pseudonocardia nigra]
MSETTVDVVLPTMGSSVTEATVTTWLKSVGDTVTDGEPLCEVSTDKVDTEIPAPAGGVLSEILVAEGDTVQLGQPLARLSHEQPGSPAPIRPVAATGPRTPSTTQPSQGLRAQPSAPPVSAVLPAPGIVVRFDPEASADEVLRRATRSPIASPAARQLTAAHDVTLDDVTGTGRQGRVRVDDVRLHVEAHLPAQAPAPQAPAPQVSPSTSPPVSPATSGEGQVPSGYSTVPYTAVRLSPRRRAIAEHMLRSRATSAHASVEAEIDLGRLSAIRDELNEARRIRQRKTMSFLPLIARATVVALRTHRELNASVAGNQLLQWTSVNLGFAVDTPEGLLVPVVREADELTAESIADRIADASGRARERRITADELTGGTFTISNLGSVRSVSGIPVINQPQVAILVTGAVVRRPWVQTLADGTESIGIRPIMRANLTFDHRVIDGAEAGRCLNLIREHLESWPTDAYQ